MRAGIMVALLLTGCSAGTTFDWDQAKKVRVGATEGEVIALMGKPYLIKTQGESEVWVWSHANGLTGKTGVVSFELRKGRVAGVPSMAHMTD